MSPGSPPGRAVPGAGAAAAPGEDAPRPLRKAGNHRGGAGGTSHSPPDPRETPPSPSGGARAGPRYLLPHRVPERRQQRLGLRAVHGGGGGGGGAERAGEAAQQGGQDATGKRHGEEEEEKEGERAEQRPPLA